MDIIDAIAKRRSIRNFKEEKIEKEIIKDILNCGRLAPSAKNRQPWYFIVLENDIKDKIADLMMENNNNEEEHTFPSSVKATAKVVKQAPVLILVFREIDDDWIIADNLSIGACCENMCLRATELGLGTLWIRDTVYVAGKIADMVGHSDMELNCCIALGKSLENPNPRPRKELKEIVEWYGK